jgi:Zn-dependent peptidase ImmA (M78 family)/transcriptional regulator with XRE-family HTH domain
LILQIMLYVCAGLKETDMSKTINPNMIQLAREARGLTQTELAEKLHLHKANVSRLEKGETNVSGETLMAISNATKFPPQFFFQNGDILPLNLSYRKRQNVPTKLITPIEASINIIRQHVQIVTRALEKEKPALPVYLADEKHTPEKIAALVRKKWSITEPVIQNLCGLLEEKEIIINSFDFKTERVDSRSMLTDDQYPVIFLNKRLKGDRQRFSLAFELGHLIMHTFNIVPHKRDVNHEANVFAAEFLMPAREIMKDFREGITLPLLGELKRKWKTSMIALLYRADDLGLLTPNQKRYLLQQFNAQKIRRREPTELDIPAERNKLMRQLLTQLMKNHKLNVSQVCTLLAIETDDYIEYYS